MALLSRLEIVFLSSFSSSFFLFLLLLFLLFRVSSLIFTSPTILNSYHRLSNSLKQYIFCLTRSSTRNIPSHFSSTNPILSEIMSASYTSHMYTSTLPMAVPGKDEYAGYYHGYQIGHNSYSVSPPESENVSSASGSASYGQPGYSTTASYAGSMQGDYDSSLSANNVDFNDYMQDRFNETFDPIPLDKSVAMQAQA